MPRFPEIAPPSALRRPKSVTVHGETIVDEYAWLRAENWREALDDPSRLDPAIRAHLEAENAYAEAMLEGTKALQARLVSEMRGRMREEDASVPVPDGPYAYLRRFREGGEHPVYCRVPREGGAETALLDCEKLAERHAYFDVGAVAHSPDHALVAWSLDAEGSESYAIRVRPAGGEDDAPDVVERTTGDVVWNGAGDGFLYVELDQNHRPARVRRHMLGTDQAQDALLHEESEPGWFVSIDRTQSGRFAAIVVSDHETSETRLVALDAPDARPELVAAREKGVRYSVEDHGDRLIIVTNADGAEDFKIVEAPIADPRRENWRDLVPHRPGVMILHATPFARHLARLEREDARPRIVLRDFATGEEHAVAFDEEAYSLGLATGLEYDTDALRFVYSSLSRPAETWDYDMATRVRTLRKREDPPSEHDPHAYVTRRIFAPAHDGETVPVSLLHRKDALDAGPAPCLLYGYGSYGHAIPASFRANILSLVDRGFVFAIAHVRGGTEKGWRWYVDGKRDKKTNTFSDFLACAQALCDQGFTRRGAIVAQGGSAGGMLMGAVANADPDAFAGIVAEVPFVDVLNTMLDGELPLTPPEWPEWGDPGSSREAFDTIRSYSPYDNVGPRRYPPILALAGLTDPRVTYWEPAKWTARLRATMTGGGPVILKTQMEAGHGGVSGRFRRLEETASVYAFALSCVDRDAA